MNWFLVLYTLSGGFISESVIITFDTYEDCNTQKWEFILESKRSNELFKCVSAYE